MASISKTIRPKRSNNNAVSPTGYGLTVGLGSPTLTGATATGWLANKPVTYTTVVTDYAWSDAIPVSTTDASVGGGWSVVYNGSNYSRRIVDTTGGVSPGYALETYYPSGLASGGGVGTMFISAPAAQTDFYVCMRLKWNDTFEWNTVSNKLIIFEPGHTLIEPRHNSDYLICEPQSLGAYYTCNEGTPTIPLGEWVTLEIIFRRGASGGIQIWMNGTRYMNRSVPMPAVGAYQQISLASTWGGSTAATSRESWRWCDHIYIATP